MTSIETQRVVKASALRELGSKVVFNFDDIRHRCDEHVEAVRRQTRKMIESAQTEADAIRQRAQAEGLQAGRTEGLKQAQQNIDVQIAQRADRIANEKLQTVLPALRAAADALAEERDRWLANWEQTAVHLAVRIAEKLLHAELAARPEAVVPMIREALRLVAGSSTVRLHVHPRDLELLGPQADAVVQGLSSCSQVEVVGDPAVAPGGCLVRTRHGSIDATIDTQLDRIAQELLHQGG